MAVNKRVWKSRLIRRKQSRKAKKKGLKKIQNKIKETLHKKVITQFKANKAKVKLKTHLLRIFKRPTW